jgi:lambda-like phage minor tail protein L
MTIESDVQLLDVPSPKVELFELDATGIGGGVVRFQYITGSDGPVMWQAEEYSYWPIETEGFARTSEQQPTPKLRVGNLDGSISLLCLIYDDMVGAVLTRHRTFARYLDGAADADPMMFFTPEIWYIERKSSETAEFVEFELVSALDFGDAYLPSGQIIANQCPYSYRGEGCGYTGIPVALADDTPTSDPLLDDCGKRPSSCKLRDWPDDILNYGGFVAAGLTRT